MGDAPKYEDAVPTERGKKLFEKSRCIGFNKSALLDELREDRTIEIRSFSGALSNKFIHQVRRDETGLWLFISRCDEPYNKQMPLSEGLHIYVNGTYSPKLYDTITGEIKPIRHDNSDGRTHMIIRLFDYDSALIFLEDTTEHSAWEPTAGPIPVEACAFPTLVDYTLSEPNVLLLDTARYSADGEPLCPPETVLRIDRVIRTKMGLHVDKPQPWVVPKKPYEHTVTLEFTVNSDIDYEKPYLALEEAEISTIVWNGETVDVKIDGYYTDKSIQKVALPPIKKGENVLRVTWPFGERSNVEAMYLLGNFGVRVAGRQMTVTTLPEKLGFSDLTYQGLPFYGGVVSYKLPVDSPEDWDSIIKVPHFDAAVNTVSVDGEKKAVIAYPPFEGELGVIPAGKHEISVNTYISRRNCFGNVHDADEKQIWHGPSAWMQTGFAWTYEYRLRRTGVLTTPLIYKK
jgi:hypothetical protein